MSKTAIVTGGSIRIGKSISIKLAEMGYDIALHYNRSVKEANETKQVIESAGANCRLYSFDLSNTEGVESFANKIFSENHDIELLVNNASIFNEIGFLNVTMDDFYREFNINFVSPFFLAREYAKNAGRGMIINLIDARITKVHAAHFVYNLTKKALRDFTLMAAKTLGPDIRVNGICPGPVLPPPGETDEYLKKIADKTPLKITGTPQYIANAVEYLVLNDFVTGEILYVDGGEHL